MNKMRWRHRSISIYGLANMFSFVIVFRGRHRHRRRRTTLSLLQMRAGRGAFDAD